jgi:hypothetical protein
MGQTSLGGNDILRAWSNPAMLSLMRSSGEATINCGRLFDGDQLSGGAGFGWRLAPDVAMGGLLAYHAIGTAEIDEFGSTSGRDLRQEVVSGGAVAAVRLGPLRLGAALKGVSETLLSRSSSTGAADLGCVLAWKGVNAGIAGRNLGPALNGSNPDYFGETLPAELRIGASFTAVTNGLTAAADYSWVRERSGTASFGMECRPASSIALRIGVTGIGPGFEPSITLGFSGTDSRMGLDYAYANHPAGSTHQAGLSFSFGSSAGK